LVSIGSEAVSLLLRPAGGGSPIRLEDDQAHALAAVLWKSDPTTGATGVAAAMTRELNHRDQDRKSVQLDDRQTALVNELLARFP
jgi:hypothetical protein